MKNEYLEMVDPCLSRLKKIGDRQPLPTQHFYVEAQVIIQNAISEAYAAGVSDGEKRRKTPSIKLPSNDQK